MTREKQYEILKSLPAYGPMHVSITGNGAPYYSEGFVVRFYKPDGAEWVGNFQPGWTKLNDVLEFENAPFLLVIAGGTCYMMNPATTKPIEVFGIGYSDIFKTNDGRVVLLDQTGLTVVEEDRNYWHTERISWDGFRDAQLKDNIVTGLSYDPTNREEEWVPFTYDLTAQILTGGSYPKS